MSLLTVFSYENVFRFQIAINDLFGVQVSKSQCDLHGKEFSLVFRELANSSQVPKELTTFDEFHEEENTEFVLENILHVYKEGVINGVENIFFELNVIHLLVLNNDVFSNGLHGV